MGSVTTGTEKRGQNCQLKCSINEEADSAEKQTGLGTKKETAEMLPLEHYLVRIEDVDAAKGEFPDVVLEEDVEEEDSVRRGSYCTP